MNRKKILKKIVKKSSKTRVPELKDFGVKYMKMIYNELYDTFVIDLDCMINGTIIKIVGDIDPRLPLWWNKDHNPKTSNHKKL